MADTTTATLGLTKPEIGGSANSWGAKHNTNLDLLDAAVAARQLVASKDATGGYAGLTLFKINFKNALNTFTSFFTNANTAARTYTYQDRDGTIADLANFTPEAVIAPTLLNSWVNYGGTEANAGYSKNPFGSVRLRGRIKTGATGTVCFTLPAGYRPPANLNFIVASDSTTSSLVAVPAGGNVTVFAGAGFTYVDLAGITFRTT